MHGRPRYPTAQSADKLTDPGKAGKLKILLAEVLRNHHERCYTKDALKKSARLLELNPEVYTAWNYRKLAVRHLMASEPDEAARKLLAEDELRLVERALSANLKSYGAWYHRKWIIDLGFSSLAYEFSLLKKLLKDDPRNFHGWAYRRFAVRNNRVPPEKELEYATEKINENFSNYSAWHYRSTLLSQLVDGDVSKEEILKDEYELVNQAYFTEPDDQSAWFYNSWLLGETKLDRGAHVVGTWPSDGSTVSVDTGEKSLSLGLSSRNPLDKEYKFYSKGFPIILSFSEVVTDVTVEVSSKPELAVLNDISFSPLSSIGGASNTWAAELPLKGCPHTEYAISLGISSPAVRGQEKSIMFNLQFTTGRVSRQDVDLGAKGKVCKGDLLWPRDILCNEEKGERRHTTEEGTVLSPGEGLEARLDGLLLSEGSQKNFLTTAVGNVDWQEKLLEEQIRNLRELLGLEKNSKWAKLTLSRVLLAHSVHTQNYGQYEDEVQGLLKELSKTDPVHTDYYKSLLSSIFIAKVLRNPENMKHLWWDLHKPSGIHLETEGWLRWTGLSLSKFGSFERLLWVQRLDLSHNHLHSVDGLEAMQLLVSLDLSHNRILHVTSLATLRLIPKLQFLNISYNEIGSHSVDSTRYSFPSLLTNQIKHFSPKDEQLHDNTTVEDLWEVQAVFGGMDWRVLEIAGNVAADDKAFRQAIVRALPALELLDGEEL